VGLATLLSVLSSSPFSSPRPFSLFAFVPCGYGTAGKPMPVAGILTLDFF
jgi:hypothetical protein